MGIIIRISVYNSEHFMLRDHHYFFHSHKRYFLLSSDIQIKSDILLKVTLLLTGQHIVPKLNLAFPEIYLDMLVNIYIFWPKAKR